MSVDRSDQTNGNSNKDDTVELSRQLQFLTLDDDDKKRLIDLVPAFQKSQSEFVETFYRHLLSFEETAQFLQDPKTVERLKKLQLEHWEQVLNADWDQKFVARCERVGSVHADRGVGPLFFLGTSVLFVEHLFHQLEADESSTKSRLSPTLLSVVKAIFLESVLTLESYFTKMTQEFQQALDMVWKANSDLRQFARLASHDLKTPLGTVANLCEEAVDEFGSQMPDEANRLISSARQTVFRMGNMIDELLSTTVSDDPDDLDYPVSLQEVIRESLDPLRPTLQKRRVDLTISENLPWVVGNRIQLREAFFNLISNAEKYLDKEPGRIEIDSELSDEECVICVIDNGPGIPPEEIDHIFTAFRRMEIHRDRPGTGLGLYFAKHLIEQQGGKIWVESEVSKGSKFCIRLKRSASQ